MIRVVPWHGKVEGDVGKGCLKAHPCRHVDIEDKFLQGLLHTPVVQAVEPYKGGEQGVEIGECLGARGLPLERVEEIHDLPECAPQVSGRPAFHLPPHTPESLCQQVMQIPSHAIHREDIKVMNMEISLYVGLPDLRGIDLAEPIDLAHLRGNIVIQSLEGKRHIAVLVYAPVRLVEVLIYQVNGCLIGDIPDPRMLLPVENIGLGRLAIGGGKQYLLHDILNLLHRRGLVAKRLLGEV